MVTVIEIVYAVFSEQESKIEISYDLMSVNQSKIFRVYLKSICYTTDRFSRNNTSVLLSQKLHTFGFSKKNKMSSMQILNRSKPIVDRC